MFSAKLKLYLVCIFTLIFSIYYLAISDVIQSSKGLVTYVEGAVKKQKLDQEAWSAVEKNAEVTSGERVRTFTKSRAEVDIAKLDKIRMAPKTIIDILKLYEETKENVIESRIKLQNGDLWANIGNKQNKLNLSIETPVAVAAITGTTLRLGVDTDSSSLLKVYKGEVVVSNAPESGLTPKSIEPYEIEGPREIPGPREVSLEEWAVIVKSMQQLKIDKKGQISYQGNFASTDQDEQTDWVKWNLDMDQNLD